MGLLFDFAKVSRPSKSRIEVNAYSLMYQNLDRGQHSTKGLRRGSPAPLIWHLEGVLHIVCPLRHTIDKACPDGLVDAETKEIDPPFCVSLKLLL